MRKTLLSALLVAVSNLVFSQSFKALYSQSNEQMANNWTGNGTLTEVQDNNTPNNQFKYIFDYTVSGWWAGVGFSLNNWGGSDAVDFGLYDSLIITYRGLQTGSFNVSLEAVNASISANQPISTQTNWTRVALPVNGFTAASTVDINNITQLRFFNGGAPSGSGQLEIAEVILKKNPVGNAPVVSITSPTNGSSQTTKNSINVAATASDFSGTITRVDFYANGQLITTDRTSPYSFSYYPQYNGILNFEAVAIDNDGNQTTSAPVSHTVNYSGEFNTASDIMLKRMTKGVNMTNWLDAYWEMGIPGFPDETKYPENFLDSLQKLGINTIRLPVVFERFSSNTYPHNLTIPHEIFDLVDSLIEWTEKRNMILIIDNHHPQTTLTESNIEAAGIRTANVMKQVVQKYDYADPNRVFFELRNEPTTITAEPLRLYLQSIIDTIRNFNTTHTLMVGGSGFNDAYNLYRFGSYNDTNTLYTYHDYNPYTFTHQGFSWAGPPTPPSGTTFASVIGDFSRSVDDFAKLVDWADSLNIGIVLGEFGASVYADETSRCDYTDTMRILAENSNMPWIYWGWMSAEVADESFGWFNSAAVQMDSIIPCMYTALDFDTVGYLPVPVSWISFTATAQDKRALLNWKVASELNNSHYEIERRVGESWDYIGFVKGVGNSSENKDYFFVDPEPNAVNHYRIKQVDFDGKYSYSSVAKLVFENSNTIAVYPNPNKGSFHIDTESHIESLSITDVAGRRVASTLQGNKVTLENCKPGLYFYHLTTFGGTYSGKITVE